MMSGTLAQVSTLLRTLGLSQRPLTAVRMYLGLGSPALPSMAVIKALDSPQTNAPAPRWTLTSKSKPDPRMFLPSSPYSARLLMAMCVFSTARGYSWRT